MLSRVWIVFLCGAAALAQTAPLTDREKALLDRIQQLEQRVAALEAAQKPASAALSPAPAAGAAAALPASDQKSGTGDNVSLPGFAAGTTLNVLLDGYYEYNFNLPIGRVNLLRPFDPTSNSFTLNQGVVAIERTPDPAAGRRFGLRLDLMFGQTTESLAGNPATEPRPIPYRNIFQAYGTYVIPLGTGLTVDFGRFASPLGLEGTYAKDQINYSRSLLFNALPFYHMGFRTAYHLGKSTTVTWMLTNGLNQMEDFNGFKSNHFMISASLSKSVSWTGSYYVGRENRTLLYEPLSQLTPPALPTQPGLSITPILPTPNGRTHIADTYLSWTATPKLTVAGEADYIVSRLYTTSSPSHAAGGAGYLKYQFVPAFSLAGRCEYVSDRSGYFTGTSQALKEGTLTATYQPAEGFQMRWEFRRDFSNQRFFLTHHPGVVQKDQNTALLGLIWWFGGKQGAW